MKAEALGIWKDIKDVLLTLLAITACGFLACIASLIIGAWAKALWKMFLIGWNL